MSKFLQHSLLLCISAVLLSCKKESSSKVEFPRDPQMARIQILNAFGATDAAIRAVAYDNPLIETVNADWGSSSSGTDLDEMRGWNIVLNPDISKDDRKKILNFVKSLEDTYRDLGSMRYPGYHDFKFLFTVKDTKTQIQVKAEGSYGKQDD